MKFKKLILPMMAFIFAIGLTFATTNLQTEKIQEPKDYIQLGGIWVEIPEQDCEQGGNICQVADGENGPYDVFDEMSDTQPKSSVSAIPNQITLP